MTQEDIPLCPIQPWHYTPEGWASGARCVGSECGFWVRDAPKTGVSPKFSGTCAVTFLARGARKLRFWADAAENNEIPDPSSIRQKQDKDP